MKFRTSTSNAGLVARIATAILLAATIASPAAADSDSKRWKAGNGRDARPGTVGQVVQQVNHREDRGWRFGHRDDGPRWKHRREGSGRHRAEPPRHFEPPRFADRHRRHGDHGHYLPPPPRFYGNRHRWSHRHRHYRPGFRHYYYRNDYVAPNPIYVIPFQVFDTRPAPVGRGHLVTGAETYCSDDSGANYAGGSRQAGGTLIGGVVGAVVGSQVGKGNGRLAAVGVGTLIGALVGRDIGRSMDAVDRGYATSAVNRALETAPTCTTITWDNPQTGNYGTITPTRTFEPSPGRYCREFQQQVVIGGTLQDAYGTACRQPDGSWEIVAEQP